MGSQVIDVLLAVLCLGIGMLHLGTASGRVGEAVAHGVMGLGMAAMFVPALDPLPQWAWIVVFGALAVWAAAATLRDRGLAGHGLHHLVGAAAMLFMVLAPHRHGGAEAAGGSLLLAVVALGFTGWFVADVARTLTSSGAGTVDGAACEASACGTTAGEALAGEASGAGGSAGGAPGGRAGAAGTTVGTPAGGGVAVAARARPLLRPARVAMSGAMVVMLLVV